MTNELIPDSMTTMVELLRWFNDLSSGLFIPGFLFSMLIVIYYVVDRRFNNGFMVSSLIIGVLATLFRAAQLINEWFVVVFWVLAGIGLMNAVWSRD